MTAELSIFEAPRFFERLVVGRHPDEVLDMVARICGICPVAYQMTAVEGFERLFGVQLDPQVRQLRRLFYWGEWLQSHALHIYLLNAPDFLGYDSAIDMARDHRKHRGARPGAQAGRRRPAQAGRRSRRASLGMRVGGFYRVPSRSEARLLLPQLEQALADAQETVRWTAAFELPDFERDPLMLSMYDPELYALDTGRLITTEGIDIDPGDWDNGLHRAARGALHGPAGHQPRWQAPPRRVRRPASCSPARRCIRWPGRRWRRRVAWRSCAATCSRPSRRAASR